MPNFHASVLQFDIALGRPEANLERALTLLAALPLGRPHLALLPEVFTTNFTFRGAAGHAAFSKSALDRLGAFARQAGIAIAGSILEATPQEGVYQNRAFFLDEEGRRLSRYAKRHLIRLGHEHLFYEAGPMEGAQIFPWRGVPLAMAICYDLRFPEFLGRLAFAGAQALLVPAQWPAERAGHWRTLLAARAIENQCFVIGCNRTGETEGTLFSGGSAILDPWGEVLAGAGEAPGVATAAIDLGRIAEIRSRLGAFGERRREEHGP